MKTKKIEKEWGVVYADNLIIEVKTPVNDVYAGQGREAFECDTRQELDSFIDARQLKTLEPSQEDN